MPLKHNPESRPPGGNQAPDQRRSWYTPAAQAYDRVRPDYPDALVDKAIKVAELPAGGHILEIGCGPGTATVSFAKRGFAITGIEPNPELCQLAEENCSEFPKVHIINALFEEWPGRAERFDAVLAATSFHWVSPEEGYPKVTHALRERGRLILLWNTPLQLPPELHERVSPIFEKYAPGVFSYESVQMQERAIAKQGQAVVGSGYFEEPICDLVRCERVLTAAAYVALLSTYTPFLKLGTREQEALSHELAEGIKGEPAGSAKLTFLSISQVYRKRAR